jgi:threonine/homoserine/homoserine lactone efflux protein
VLPLLRTFDIQSIDWNQKIREAGAFAFTVHGITITPDDVISIVEKAASFAIGAYLAYLAWRRHRKKMEILEIQKQREEQELWEKVQENKKKFG